MLRRFLLAFVFQGRERCVDFLGQIAGSGLRASVGGQVHSGVGLHWSDYFPKI
jgi:hypothetical protein